MGGGEVEEDLGQFLDDVMCSGWLGSAATCTYTHSDQIIPGTRDLSPSIY